MNKYLYFTHSFAALEFTILKQQTMLPVKAGAHVEELDEQSPSSSEKEEEEEQGNADEQDIVPLNAQPPLLARAQSVVAGVFDAKRTRADMVARFEQGTGTGPLSIEALKRLVVDACSCIFRALGQGHSEYVYQNALARELHNANIVAIIEQFTPFYYKNECVGWGNADLVIQSRLIIELKQQRTPITHYNLQQCRKYMRTLGIGEGMVINFPQVKTKR